MSAVDSQTAVLSREELSALFEAAERGGDQIGPRRVLGLADAGASRAELTNAALRFAEEQARSLSTLHQTSIRLRFSHWEEISLRQFASATLQTDKIACLDLGNAGSDVYLQLSRPLVFGWMMLAFGAQPAASGELLPSRDYTRIETRFIQRAAAEVAQTFSKALGGDPKDAHVVALADPTSLYERSKRPHLVASFEVEGLGELCRIRLALPNTFLDGVAETTSQPVQSERMAEQLLDMTVEVRARVGFADVSLRDVATLRPGDQLRLQRSSNDRLIIHVEGQAKYAAEAGSAGGKLAVRITEVLRS